MGTKVLVVPGINNSGPAHWQSLWEQGDPAFRRIRVPDWDRPVCADWVAAIGDAVREAGAPLVIVAHSLGCLALAAWAAGEREDSVRAVVRGLMFVAVPDPQGPNFPDEATGFAPVPAAVLPAPAIVVASEDDPYGGSVFGRRCADAWGARFVDVGAAGHINADSGLGDWPQGRALLESLRA